MLKLPFSLHLIEVNEFQEYFTSETEDKIESSLRIVIDKSNGISSFFDRTIFFTGVCSGKKFHLTKIIKMKLFESNPKYTVIGEIEKGDYSTIIKAQFKMKDQNRLFITFAVTPLALTMFGILNSNTLVIIIGTLSYVILDFLFPFFLRLNIARCKKDFERFLYSTPQIFSKT